MSIADVCPDERETLRVGCYLFDRLERERLWGRDKGLGERNEFSVATELQLHEWVAHARHLLGLEPA